MVVVVVFSIDKNGASTKNGACLLCNERNINGHTELMGSSHSYHSDKVVSHMLLRCG